MKIPKQPETTAAAYASATPTFEEQKQHIEKKFNRARRAFYYSPILPSIALLAMISYTGITVSKMSNEDKAILVERPAKISGQIYSIDLKIKYQWKLEE